MSMLHYLTSNSEGYQQDHLCDGMRHYIRLEDYGKSTLNESGICDGSCTNEARRLDLRAFVAARAREEIELKRGAILSSVVEFDSAAAKIFDGEDSLLGIEFDRWYAKRSGEGCTCCTGTHHVRISIDHDWWACRDTGRYETIKVSATPCDGTCVPRQSSV